MIPGLPSAELEWLSVFFAPPNDLNWGALVDGSAEEKIAESIRPWLEMLNHDSSEAPIILPVIRGSEAVRWYASPRRVDGNYELGAEIEAWLGPAYLKEFEAVAPSTGDPFADAMYSRVGAVVYQFSGSDQATNRRINDRLADFVDLLGRRPFLHHQLARPVGTIRADFERALLAQHAGEAEARIGELRETGRLNEENLRYLDVRLKAGLGYWPQIARDHWLIQTLSDLALPPQTLADLLEALYRTYVDEVEANGNPAATLRAFDLHIAKRYPRLFTSRRGVRTPRVVKAFLLYEQLQSAPSRHIIANLLELLPESDRVLSSLPSGASEASESVTSRDADQAFDDAQYDRALEFYLALPLGPKSISRLVSCVLFVGTDEARAALSSKVETADDKLLSKLAPAIQKKLAELRSRPQEVIVPPTAGQEVSRWMTWVKQLSRGEDLAGAEVAVQQAATNWDMRPFAEDESLSNSFAVALGNLSGEAGRAARRSVPLMFASFFPPGGEPGSALKPIGRVLFDLIAMDEVLSRTDRDLLAQLLAQLLALGMSSEDYLFLVADLEDVQSRVGSYGNLPWSFDICEALAIAPSPSSAGKDARLRFFLSVLSQTQAFAHRLQEQDRMLLEFLAKDYGVDTNAIAWAKRNEGVDTTNAQLPKMDGKTIGIYTLAEAAGVRAKITLESLFPGCNIAVNSDLVCTSQLKSLAKAADLFVFAWKSSSHQAFYCVKDALENGEPIWAQGKGTASIVRAVLDNIG